MILLSCLLMSCSSAQTASGPSFQDTALTNNNVGRIIIFQPFIPFFQRNLSNTTAYLNNVRSSTLSYGGHHIYMVEPGLHMLTLTKLGLHENIPVNIKANETIYFKLSTAPTFATKDNNFNILNKVKRNEALLELINTQLDFTKSVPYKTIDLSKGSIIAPRNHFTLLLNTNPSNYIEIMWDGYWASIVSPGFNTFDVEFSYPYLNSGSVSMKAEKELSIDVKKNCIYLITVNARREDYALFNNEEFCQTSINE